MAHGCLSQGVIEGPQMQGSRARAEEQWLVRGQIGSLGPVGGQLGCRALG